MKRAYLNSIGGTVDSCTHSSPEAGFLCLGTAVCIASATISDDLMSKNSHKNITSKGMTWSGLYFGNIPQVTTWRLDLKEDTGVRGRICKLLQWSWQLTIRTGIKEVGVTMKKEGRFVTNVKNHCT